MVENFLCVLWLVIKHGFIIGLCLEEPRRMDSPHQISLEITGVKTPLQKLIRGVHQQLGSKKWPKQVVSPSLMLCCAGPTGGTAAD